MRFDECFVREALSDVSIACNNFPAEIRVAIDSRIIQQGDIFVALSGLKTDGHNFLNEALKKGAAGLIISADKQHVLNNLQIEDLHNKLVIVVPDTQRALCDLATAWRSQFNGSIVAITGSVGKTSTKMILSNILELYETPYLSSYGNQNTCIGAALNLLKLRPSHRVAIIEAGVNKRGEMADLARMIMPTTAIITNVGHSHMEGLGSLADVALEKRDIFSYFTEKSIGIINGDQMVLANVGYVHPVIKFGSKTINQVQSRKINIGSSSISFVLKLYSEKFPVVLQHTHAGMVNNVLAAAAAAHWLGVPNKIIIRGIQVPITIAGRFEKKPLKPCSGFIIHDCYNANPESMKASLLAFHKIDTKSQKVAVIGDMLELGVNSPFWHRQLGRFLRKASSLKYVILVGNMVEWTKKTLPVGLQVELFPSWYEASQRLEEILTKESLVLVKGSHGTGLHNLVNRFASNL